MREGGRLRVREGDLFASKAQTLVNTVNCVGVMGKGVALEFRKRFPDMYEDYVARCRRGEVRLGRPYLFRYENGPWILNFPTKGHWRAVSRLRDIVEGLDWLERHYREWGIRSLAVPPLGCGNGGLDWAVVGPTLYRHFARFDIPVELYAPHGTPAEQLTLAFLDRENADAAPTRTRIDPARLALGAIVGKITREPYHWPVGRVSFQKLAYFATHLGLPTNLNFGRGSYGPFAPDLKRVASELVNQGILEERRAGRGFVLERGPAFADAMKLLDRDHVERWRPIVAKVVDLALRLPPRELEVAASVHFVAQELSRDRHERPSEREIVREVLAWKPSRVTEELARSAVRALNLLGWIDAEPDPEFDPDDEPVPA